MHPVILRALLLLVCLAVTATAQTPSRGAAAPKPDAASAKNEPDRTALGAIASLPKDVGAKIARIEGPDGRPFPERWYVLIHDAEAFRGFREYVVSDGKVIANRGLSQFADNITSDDVIGATAVKFNSDEAAGIAAQFAMHNSQALGTIRYELTKAAAPPAPTWRLTCFDPAGQMLGTIVMHATKGSLISFQGFEKSPIVPQPESATATPVAQGPESRSAGERTSRSTSATSKPKKPAASSRSSNAPPPVARAVRPPPRQRDDGVGGFFRRVFRD